MELAELVRAAQRGERAATTELYARFHRAVHAVVLAHARYADAADLVQDVFVAALLAIPPLTTFVNALAKPTKTTSLRRSNRQPPSRKTAAQALMPIECYKPYRRCPTPTAKP
jgi:DNA-directed RNA polymerase specialized sigma24 family protein